MTSFPMTTELKLAAIKELYPETHFVQIGAARRMVIPGLRTQNGFDLLDHGTQRTDNECIDEVWFWLTGKGSDMGSRMTAPSWQDECIILEGEYDQRYRWDGFVWARGIRQMNSRFWENEESA